jgi:hypothetical protein
VKKYFPVDVALCQRRLELQCSISFVFVRSIHHMKESLSVVLDGSFCFLVYSERYLWIVEFAEPVL